VFFIRISIVRCENAWLILGSCSVWSTNSDLEWVCCVLLNKVVWPLGLWNVEYKSLTSISLSLFWVIRLRFSKKFYASLIDLDSSSPTWEPSSESCSVSYSRFTCSLTNYTISFIGIRGCFSADSNLGANEKLLWQSGSALTRVNLDLVLMPDYSLFTLFSARDYSNSSCSSTSLSSISEANF